MANIIAITHACELFTCWSALQELCTMSRCLGQRNQTFASQKEFSDFAAVSVTLPKSLDITDHMHLFTKQ